MEARPHRIGEHLDRPRYRGRLHTCLRPAGDRGGPRERARFSSAALLHDHGVVSGLATPIAGRDGRAYGVLGAHTKKRRKFHDSTYPFLPQSRTSSQAIQRRQLDQRHELMIRELRHRSGNLFSQLLALFSQTAKNSRSVADLVAKYEARRTGTCQRAPPHYRGRLEIDFAQRTAQYAASRNSWIESRSEGRMSFSSRIPPSV